VSFNEDTQTMIHRERRLAWGQQEAADKKLRRFRRYGLLLLGRTAAARVPVTLLAQADRFRAL
jgi:hypothetical protein